MTIDQINKEIERLKKLRDIKLTNKHIKCIGHPLLSGCGKTFKVGNTTLLQPTHYIEPYGCTSGDYYVRSEGELQYVCPKCKLVNRVFDCTKLENLRPYFKDVVDIDENPTKIYLKLGAKNWQNKGQ